MAPTVFKLIKPNDAARRVSFPNRPTWSVLSGRIAALFGMPIEQIAVTYMDNDGDEITLSSDEELQEYYKSCSVSKEVIRFIVRDLHEERVHTRSIPNSPRKLPHFFSPAAPFMEDDWQRLPTFDIFEMAGSDITPHAYVETIDSQTETHSGHEDTATGKAVSDAPETPEPQYSKEKGKGKASAPDEDEASSTESVISNSLPKKPPVHVYAVSGNGPKSDSPLDAANVFAPLFPVQATPRAQPDAKCPVSVETQMEPVPTVLDRPQTELSKSSHDSPKVASGAKPSRPGTSITDQGAPDPPLPPVTDTTPSPEASLTNDVASFLDSLMGAFASHPEVSEQCPNIFRNVATGTYWQAHREAVSRAAADIRRAAQSETTRGVDDLRRAEQEAGKGVSEMVGAIFRALADLRPSKIESTASAPAFCNGSPSTTAPPHDSSQENRGPHVPPPTPPPPPPPHASYGGGVWPPNSLGHDQPWTVPLPAPPPPPPPFLRGNPHGYHMRPGPPPSVFPPSFHPPPLVVPQIPSQFMPAFSDHLTQTDNAATGHQALRQRVEQAKALYKAEKERYRRDKEERKKQWERKDSGLPKAMPGDITGVSSHAPEPVEEPTVVSNARGSFPRLEMFNVPRRSHTYSGPHAPRGAPTVHSIRSPQRIIRRLADMGFTENSFPGLQAKVNEQVSSPGTKTEDDIVTDLVEEILSYSPKASGPGFQRHGNISGAWQGT